ncbi:MAG: peptidase domain-containing ABC transporter [Cyanobacteria bacterium J069]|nr:MAG: peptidase domain-containing ABC transporter [Cyanobacteria bacterium J069]
MRYPLILQHSREDCGVACLASIAKHYGRTVSFTRIREAIGTGQLGTTLLGLRRGAEALGFRARSVVASAEALNVLDRMPLPAILHWQGSHWVVLYGQKGGQRGDHPSDRPSDRFVIADPAVGVRFLSQAELLEGWANGVILLLEPDPERLYSQPDDPVMTASQLWQRIQPYRWVLLQAVICASLIGLLSLASPVFLQILTDEVLLPAEAQGGVLPGQRQMLLGVVAAVMALYVFRSGLSLAADLLIARFAQRLELGFVLEFGQQVLRLPLTYYETRRSGEVVSRLRDIEEINRLVSDAVVSLPSTVLVAAVSFGLMLAYSWRLTLVAVLVAIAMTLSTVWFQPVLRQKTRAAMVLETENQGVLVETFKGALTLKTIDARSPFAEELQQRFRKLATLLLQTMQIGIINSNFSGLVSDLGNALLLGIGGLLVFSQDLSVGQLLAFTTLNRNVVSLVDLLVGYVDDTARVQTANARLHEVIAATPEADDPAKPWVTLSGDAAIACAGVNFYYPGRVELLKDFSLTIPGGQAIALIGRTGCGKSTLAKVIAGLHQPQSGTVRIGDQALSEISLACVRRQVVLVPQDSFFWSRSIVDNFRLAQPEVTQEDIQTACQMTGADGFIQKLPDGYQTILGEFGSTLSGGQRQRLAIARALLSDPPLLILDESTSGLDPVSEAELLDKLLWHRQGKTTLLISHRPNVIRLASWVVFLEDGSLKLAGTMDDVRSQAGDHLNFLNT